MRGNTLWENVLATPVSPDLTCQLGPLAASSPLVARYSDLFARGDITLVQHSTLWQTPHLFHLTSDTWRQGAMSL